MEHGDGRLKRIIGRVYPHSTLHPQIRELKHLNGELRYHEEHVAPSGVLPSVQTCLSNSLTVTIIAIQMLK